MAAGMVDYNSIIGSLDCELPAKKLFKQSLKKRYLGDVDSRQHRINIGHALNIPLYQPFGCPSPQTITYRQKTSGEILQEEQQKYHSYCITANTPNTSPRRSQTAFLNKRRTAQPLISVTGENQSRPQTSAARISTSLSQRNVTPRTQASWNPKSAAIDNKRAVRSQSAKQIKFDADYIDNKIAYENAKSDIIRHRRPQSHTLNIGAYKRGDKNENGSVDSGNQQWLTFGGGVKNSGGMIEAFTVMKNPEEYYSIDGSTGTVIAKQLRKQDKISIGINGKPVVRKNKFQELGISDFEDFDDDFLFRPSALKIPLCWNDQFEHDEASPVKVIEPSTPREQKKKENLCESHPVVFNKLVNDGTNTQVKAAVQAKPPPGGFSVKRRNRRQKGLNGNDSSLTDISIDDNNEDQENGNLEYEQILEYAVGQTHNRSVGWEQKYKDLKDMKGHHKMPNYRKETSSAKTMKSANSDKYAAEPKFIVKPTPSSPASSGKHEDLLITVPGSRTFTSPPSSSNKSNSKSLNGKLIRGRSNMGSTPPSIRNDYNVGETSFIKINHSYNKPSDEEIHTSSITVLSVSGDDYHVNENLIESVEDDREFSHLPIARANSPASVDNEDLDGSVAAPPNTYRAPASSDDEKNFATNEELSSSKDNRKEVSFSDENKEITKKDVTDNATEADDDQHDFAISVSIKTKSEPDE
ncbi:uncharacterized protein LOC141899823 [Tubulanus polymorphus]|uniref:uncharacterized protein LOC141899823 n=1 Tax=Tubulanus polymorphus TaxID=672921 RepID=UPI003DA46102